MKKWVQKTAGLILGVFLTLGLSAKVRAADEEEALPAPAPTEVSEPAPAESAPSEAPKPAAEVPVSAPAAAPAEENKPSEPEAPKTAEIASAPDALKPAETAPAAEAPKPAEIASAPEAPKPAEASPVEEPAPVEESAPVEEPSPVEESSPIEESAPLEESLPADEPVSPEEPDTASVPSSEETRAAAGGLSETVTAPTRVAAPARSASSSAGGSTEDDTDPDRSPEEDASASGITVGGKDVAEEDGWTYDELSGQVGLVNFDHADIDIVSSGLNGLNIAAAGLNRLRSIVSEGDVSVTGTGLMLVDSVELGENSAFSLQTPTDIYEDGTGSVALFIKSGENEYTLANGTLIVGLLDEQYTLSGVNLVVPEGATLFLNSGGTVYDKDTHDVVFRFTGNEGEALAQKYGVTLGLDDESSTHGLDETYGTLTIGSAASLTVEDGGTVRMASTKGIRSWSDHSKPLISAENGGSLVIDGAVTGDGRITLEEGSSMTGTGSAEADQITVNSTGALADCGVTFRSKMLRFSGNGTIPKLNIEDSDVFVNYHDGEIAITELVNSGSSSLIINKGGKLTLGSISNSGTVSVYSNTEYPSADAVCDLTGVVTGGALRLSGGIFHLRDRFALAEGAALACDHVIVYDHVGSSASFGAPLIVSPGKVTMPEPADGRCTVPLVAALATYHIKAGEYRTTEINGTEFSEVFYIRNSDGKYVLDLSDPKCYKDGVNCLTRLLQREDIDEYNKTFVYIEFQTMDEEGNLSLRSRRFFYAELEDILKSTDGDSDALSFELGDTYLVRITVSNSFSPLPTGTVTSPSTSFTGTGTLGGAGSLGSGSGIVLFRGSASPHHDPQPDPSDTDDLSDPAIPDTVSPDPAPPGSEQDASLPAAAANDLRVIVSPRGRYYAVHVYHGTREVADPGRKMTARMKFTLPDGWSKNAVFAVFRGADGSLTAFRAVYNEADGTLSFDTDLTGTFALISFPFDGDPFSEEFYDAISELEDIRLLPVRR